MDGSQKPITHSLQRTLSQRLSLAIVSVALVAGSWAYWVSLREAHEFQDGVLSQIALLVDENSLPKLAPASNSPQNHEELEAQVYVQLLTEPTEFANALTPTSQLNLPFNLKNGFQTVEVDRTGYRVFVRPLSNKQYLAVAQSTEVRDEIAQNNALSVLLPFLILVLVLLLLVANLVRKLFKPITKIASEIDKRDERELYPIAFHQLPLEIEPFVVAINRLLARVAESMARQQRFVADAAHELQSPLAALLLQAEGLGNTTLSATARERLQVLHQGIQRSSALLKQLLQLARVQASSTPARSQVSIQQSFKRVIEDLLPLAEQKNIDIGVLSETDALIYINELDLITLLKNLIDNAIRYSPEGGRVDLYIANSQTQISVIVEDSGPGLPEVERQRVFDPFYRVIGSNELGSGLGLSIVKTIAQRVGAEVSLDYTNAALKNGLRVVVLLAV